MAVLSICISTRSLANGFGRGSAFPLLRPTFVDLVLKALVFCPVTH